MSRKLIAAAIAVTMALVPPFAVGGPDPYNWGTYPVAKGYSGPSAWDFWWVATGLPRPVAAVTATLVVYSKRPVNGTGGVVLFVEPMTPAGDPNPTNEMVAFLSTTDTARPGVYWAEIYATEGAITDASHGLFEITGF